MYEGSSASWTHPEARQEEENEQENMIIPEVMESCIPRDIRVRSLDAVLEGLRADPMADSHLKAWMNLLPDLPSHAKRMTVTFSNDKRVLNFTSMIKSIEILLKERHEF